MISTRHALINNYAVSLVSDADAVAHCFWLYHFPAEQELRIVRARLS